MIQRQQDEEAAEAALEQRLIYIRCEPDGRGRDRGIQQQRKNDLAQVYVLAIAVHHCGYKRDVHDAGNARRLTKRIIKRQRNHQDYSSTEAAAALYYAGYKRGECHDKIFNHFLDLDNL